MSLDHIDGVAQAAEILRHRFIVPTSRQDEVCIVRLKGPLDSGLVHHQIAAFQLNRALELLDRLEKAHEPFVGFLAGECHADARKARRDLAAHPLPLSAPGFILARSVSIRATHGLLLVIVVTPALSILAQA